MPLYLVRLKPGHEMEWGGMFQADTPADLIDLVGEEVHPRFYLYKEIQSPLGVMLPLYAFDLDDETTVVTGSTEDTFRMSGNLYAELNDSEGWSDLERYWKEGMSLNGKMLVDFYGVRMKSRSQMERRIQNPSDNFGRLRVKGMRR